MYVTVAGDERRHRLTAACHAHGPQAVLILHSAAEMHGIDGVWPTDDRVHLALPPGTERHQQEGIVVHTRIMRSDEITTVDGLRTASAARTVVDLACSLDRMAAVSVMDSALQRRLLDVDELAHLARTTTRRRGAKRCRPWWSEADGRAQSPLETRVRLHAKDAGYPVTDLQLPIVRNGRVIAYGDLAWRQPNGRWLIGEADGARYHDTPEAVFHDRTRSNRIVAGGDVDIVRFTWRDTGRRPTIGQTLAPFLGPRDRRS